MNIVETQESQIYRTYYPKVYGYLSSRLNRVQDAEDLAADVFTKVFAKLDRYDAGKSSLSTWIFTVTRNTLTDYYRTRKVFEEIPEIPDESGSVEDGICNAEMLERLSEALKTLDERERDIIIFRFYFNKKHMEIAEKMGISYSYVRVLQNKALKKLRSFFSNSDFIN